MKTTDPLASMWMDACDMLSRSERLRRQVFSLIESAERYACWEPPVDIFETGTGLRVVVLLPGVSADKLDLRIDGDMLIISGESPFPAPAHARIHRLEIPYGTFHKRLHLPSPHYEIQSSEYRDGCLSLQLNRHR